MLLLLALSLVAHAQSGGILSHINGGRAVFLEGSEIQTYEVTPDLAYKLKHRGMGSLWEYEPLPGMLHSAKDCGNDPEVQSALQALNQFVIAVNAQNWEQARTLTAAPLPGPFEAHTLSAQRSDWSLQAAKPGRLLVQIVSIQGGQYDAKEEMATRPKTFQNQFTLARTGTRWQVESFR